VAGLHAAAADIEKGFDDATSRIREMVELAIKTIEDVMSRAMQAIKDGVEDVTRKLRPMIDSAISKIKEVTENAIRKLKAGIIKLRRDAGSLIERGKGDIESGLNRGTAFFSDTLRRTSTAVRSSTHLSTIENVAKRGLTIGEDVVGTIVSDAKKAVEDAKAGLSDVAGKIADSGAIQTAGKAGISIIIFLIFGVIVILVAIIVILYYGFTKILVINI
jgi:t-SNARE complex subunit (syntaxin)